MAQIRRRGLFDYVASFNKRYWTNERKRRVDQVSANLALLAILVLSLIFLGVLFTIPVMIVVGLFYLSGMMQRSREAQEERLEKRLQELQPGQPTIQTYTCPHCQKDDLVHGQTYCDGCGNKLNWGS